MTARKVPKAKVLKAGKRSRAPLYILIVAVVIIFSLLGVGLYYSVGSVNPNLLLMVVVIIGATILIELVMKRGLYFGGRGDGASQDENRSAEPHGSADDSDEPTVRHGRT